MGKLVATLILLTVLNACGGGLPSTAPQKMRIRAGDMVIAGPKGFCIDPSASRDGASNAFVLLGSCAAISKLPFRQKPDLPAVLMVTVSGEATSVPVAQSMKRLAAFFKSTEGRAALSRDGEAKTVEVVEIIGKDDVFYLHALDYSNSTLAGAGAEYWRALFDIKGHLVSASVFGLKDRPIPAKEGFQTLEAFVSRIRSENLK